jgi:hypothetical protein
LFRPLAEVSDLLGKLKKEVDCYDYFEETLKQFFFTVNTQKHKKIKLLAKREEMDRNLDLNGKDFRNNEIVQKGEEVDKKTKQTKVRT